MRGVSVLRLRNLTVVVDSRLLDERAIALSDVGVISEGVWRCRERESAEWRSAEARHHALRRRRAAFRPRIYLITRLALCAGADPEEGTASQTCRLLAESASESIVLLPADAG